MKDCPVLIQSVNALRSLKIDKKIALEDSLDSINLLLLTWGFTSDRSLSSSEYQLFEKYQNESLILNRLSNFYKKVSLFDAIKILNTHLNSVIFNPKVELLIYISWAHSRPRVCILILHGCPV